MAEERIITVFDLLPEEAMESIDKLGYTFLAERGYDTEGAREDEEKRGVLSNALAEAGEELRYRGAFDRETGAILVWFELYRGDERTAVSQGIKFLPRNKGEAGNG